MDGFFGNTLAATSVDKSNDREGVDLFAQAIAGRFNNPDRPLLTARLTPSNLLSNSPMKGIQDPGISQLPTPLPTLSTSMQPIPLNLPAPRRHPPQSASSSSSANPSISSAEFTTANASTLGEIIRSPNALIIDVRPHSAYVASRIPHAVSLSVPTTLLKRPAFSLQKLSLMLSSPSARSRIQNFANASRILVYDADSSQLQENSNLLGLMRKFRAVSYTGDIAWLQGGIQSLWRDHRHFVEEDPVSEDEEEMEGSSVLRARQLPRSAFQQSSTTAAKSSLHTAKVAKPRSLSLADLPSGSDGEVKEAEQPRRAAANPFYDNIRQNLELSHGITERIPLRLSPTTSERVKEIPFAWLRSIASIAGQDDCTEALAMQFYRIELGEQRRLQGIMAHHSSQCDSTKSESNTGSSSTVKEGEGETVFPYSIIAGVEKGGKNRYRNIWPFEHSRVRLQDENDDYVNASFVHPLGTRKRYIATQGPLPQTFTDFWTVVWDQGVRVIVMLTRQHEGGSLKCGKYWEDGQYGPLRLRMIKKEGSEEEEDPGETGGGFFTEQKNSRRSPSVDDGHNHTIRRVFELVNTESPHEKPRIVTQLQYLGWPDMDVPASPKSLLKLMFDVDALAALAQHDHCKHKGRHTPTQLLILMHCSAGVGRTGAFIIIDAILDSMRLEIRSKLAKEKAKLVVTDEEEVRVDLELIANYSHSSNVLQRIPSMNAMDIDFVSTTHSVRSTPPKSSAPTSDRDATSSEASSQLPTTHVRLPFRTFGNVAMRDGQEISNSDRGQVVMLPIGDESEGIHVPLVPSSASPAPLQTPRPSFRSLQPSDSISDGGTSRASTQFTFQPPILPHSHSMPHFRPRGRESGAVQMHRQIQTGSAYVPDFTNDDVESMFEKETNPDFAMDIESVRPQSERDALFMRPHNDYQAEVGTDGSGSGSGSSGRGGGMLLNLSPVRSKDDSGSGSGSGSEGRQLRPLREAFANMSSADDEKGPMPVYDTTRVRGTRGYRGTASDGSASGSGEYGGSGGSASDVSGKVSSGSARSVSSVALDAFSALGVASPIPSPGHKSERAKQAARASESGSGGGQASLKQASGLQGLLRPNIPMNKPSLLQPKPLRLQSAIMPELIEGVACSSSESVSEKRSRPTAQLPLRHRQTQRSDSSSTSISTTTSGSSLPSASSSSLLLNSGVENYETPPSTESLGNSHSLSPSQQKQARTRTASSQSLSLQAAAEEPPKHEGSTVFDYAAPRAMMRDSKTSPPLLSSMNEPIRQVLEDMREQRMSLCQSLRQYVFVHKAIVEGAIMILDEERKALDAEGGEIDTVLNGIFEATPPAESIAPEASGGLPSTGGTPASGYTSADENQLSSKRRSSPTELPKKDHKGVEKLTKRPSVKRGKSSSSGSSSSASS